MNVMKKIEDYLHLYMGCKVQTPHTIGINLGLFYPQAWAEQHRIGRNGVNVYYPDANTIYVLNFEQVKPILRPLSAMTKEEETRYYTIQGENAFDVFEGKSTLYLLQQHFDLFDLIASRLALDATTITK